MRFIPILAFFFPAALFHLLTAAFGGFSRLSLARFPLEKEQKRKFVPNYIEDYDLVLAVLRSFSGFLQALFLLTSFLLLKETVAEPFNRLLILTVVYIAIFHIILDILAFRFREKVFRLLAPLMFLAWILFAPLKWLFSLFIKKEAVENRDNLAEETSENQIDVFIQEGAKEGVIAEEDQEMIASIIEFGDTLVKEIMTPRVDVECVSLDITLDDLIAFINEKKKSRFPVFSKSIDDIEGVILSKDAFQYWRKKPFLLKEIVRPPFFVPETMRVFELMREMQKSKQKFAVVVDEFGGVSGVVTMEDIVEEIVGEIKDEYDEDIEPIIRNGDHYVINGDTDIYELNEALKTDFNEDEDYQTVAGMISFLLGRIPSPGDQVVSGNLLFEVMEVDRNRIKRVKLYEKKQA